jgi:uncharacterized protein
MLDSMDKNIRISLLLDFYGAFLTEKQRSLMEMHYNEDLSLGEIAERSGITRQGAHDAIKRGEEVLERCEERLKLLEKYLAVKASLGGLIEFVKDKAALGEADTVTLKARLLEAAAIWEDDNGL